MNVRDVFIISLSLAVIFCLYSLFYIYEKPAEDTLSPALAILEEHLAANSTLQKEFLAKISQKVDQLIQESQNIEDPPPLPPVPPPAPTSTKEDTEEMFERLFSKIKNISIPNPTPLPSTGTLAPVLKDFKGEIGHYLTNLWNRVSTITYLGSCSLEYWKFTLPFRSQLYLAKDCVVDNALEEHLNYYKSITIDTVGGQYHTELLALNIRKAANNPEALIQMLQPISTDVKYIVFWFGDNPLESFEENFRIERILESLDTWMEDHPPWTIIKEPGDFTKSGAFWVLKRLGDLQAEKQISKVQFPQNCQDVKYYVTPHHAAGYGSFFYCSYWALVFGVQTGRTTLMLPPWDYYTDKDDNDCRSRSFFCYFLKISNCSLDDALAVEEKSVGHKLTWDEIRSRKATTEQSLIYGHPGPINDELGRKLHFDAPWLWHWGDQQKLLPYYAYFARQRYLFRRDVSRAKKDMFPDWEYERYIGIHIRHGDRNEGPQIPWEYFIRVLSKVSALYGIKTVYLATDDSTLLEKTAEYPQYKWNFAKDTSHMHEGSFIGGSMFSQQHMTMRKKMLVTTIADSELLRDCSYFIGTSGSNYSAYIRKLWAILDREVPHTFVEMKTINNFA